MPSVGGLELLERIRHTDKTKDVPVVVLTGAHDHNLEERALEMGAIEVVGKPGSAYSVTTVVRRVAGAIRAAAAAKISKPATPAEPAAKTGATANAGPPPASGETLLKTTNSILAIGASTGGTEAIKEVLARLPNTTPGTLIVQHMPEQFTSAFAKRLDGLSPMEVREARDGDLVVPGVALLAPGNRHMVLQRSGARYLVRLNQGPQVHYQRPSVDVLFHSVAQNAGANAVGVILTGMGADGAKGMLAMRKFGAHTLAQDEASCVVFGMPREAIALGAAEHVCSLNLMAQNIVRILDARQRELATSTLRQPMPQTA